MKGPHLSEDNRQSILALYVAGMATKAIADQFHVAANYPTTLARRRGVLMRGPVPHYARKQPDVEPNTPSVVRRDAEKLIKLIPPDTRDLTGRLMGDPIPGRSALDRSAAQ